MNDQEYIRKAVELADGWEMHSNRDAFVRYFGDNKHDFISFYFDPDLTHELTFGLDALAAQLVRQVDALKDPELRTIYFMCDGFGKAMIEDMSKIGARLAEHEGPDRTMNTIKAIVDSGILTTGD